MRLDLIQPELELPPFRVERGKFGGGGFGGIEESRDQTKRLGRSAITDSVLDDTDRDPHVVRDAAPPSYIHIRSDMPGQQLGQIRAVIVDMPDREVDRGGNTPEQRRTGLGRVPPQLVAVEPAIRQ